jgi:hypothetical protein
VLRSAYCLCCVLLVLGAGGWRLACCSCWRSVVAWRLAAADAVTQENREHKNNVKVFLVKICTIYIKKLGYDPGHVLGGLGPISAPDSSTYNNMGSKTMSTKCTFASLTRKKKKTLKDMLA